MIKVVDRFTSISVAPDETRSSAAERLPQRRSATGARVTVAFWRQELLPSYTSIRVLFDIAENGDLREIHGIPQYTHTNMRHHAGAEFHYRLSHWIPATAVMQFVQEEQMRPRPVDQAFGAAIKASSASSSTGFAM